MFGVMLILGSLGSLLVGIVVYFARCYATILNQSSAGVETIHWPKDSPYAWLEEGWLVLVVFAGVCGLAASLAIPALVIATERWHTIGILVLAALFVWTLFPIALCGCGQPQLFTMLPLRPGPMFHVWAMTLPLSSAATFGFVMMILSDNPLGAIVVTVAGPPAVLVHARAWGRLVWLVLDDRPRRRRRTRPRTSEPELEPNAAIRSAEPAAASRPGSEDAAYGLEASDWMPESGHLSEHYEIQRERERWDRLRAGEEIADPFRQRARPKPWSALAPSKVFGILLQADTAFVWICMTIGAALWAGLVFAIK